MADVELILKIDNISAITSIKETELALAELKQTSEGGSDEHISLLKKQISVLGEMKKRTEEVGDSQEEYNDIIGETAGGTDRVNSSMGTMGRRMGSVAAIVTVLVGTLRSLATAFKETTAGMNATIKVGSVFRQLMYDIVTLNFKNGDSTKKGLELARQQLALQRQQIASIKTLADYQVLYNKYTAEANNNNLNAKDRIEALTLATGFYNSMLDTRVNLARTEYENSLRDLEMKPKSHKLQQKTNELYASYILLQQEQILNNDRLKAQELEISTEEYQKNKEKYLAAIQAANDAYDKRLADQQKFQDLSIKLIDEYLQSEISMLSGEERLAAERDYQLRAIAEFRKTMEQLGTLTPEQKKMFEALGMAVWSSFHDGIQEAQDKEKADGEDVIDQLIKQYDEDWKAYQHYENMTILDLIIGDVEEKEKQKKEAIDIAQDLSYQILGILDNTYQKRVQDAARERELLDSRILFLQHELDTELSLMEQGYANNVDAKKKELQQIESARREALRKEEQALKQQRTIEAISQGISLATAVANLLKDTTKMGVAGLLVAGVSIGTLFTMWSMYQSQAKSSTTYLAEGGTGTKTGMITGRRHSQGGEKFLDHVEVEGGERWGVLSRRASGKYGEVFDYMVDSFNKDRIPDIVPQVANIVNVENSGPNSRLDKVITEQKKLNDKYSKDPRVLVVGGKRIITRGNNTRIIV